MFYFLVCSSHLTVSLFLFHLFIKTKTNYIQFHSFYLFIHLLPYLLSYIRIYSSSFQSINVLFLSIFKPPNSFTLSISSFYWNKNNQNPSNKSPPPAPTPMLSRWIALRVALFALFHWHCFLFPVMPPKVRSETRICVFKPVRDMRTFW